MKLRILALTLILTLAGALCAIPAASMAETIDLTALYKNKDVNGTWSAADATLIDLNAQSGSILTLTDAGDYVISGSWKGQIVIEASEDAKVRLILNGAGITSPSGPAIYEKQADKLIVTLADGTKNALTDGPAIIDGDDTIGAALYAEDDLSINGSGALTVSGTVKHGIQSKADLIIASGDISVTAVTDGIRGRNSILMLGGRVSVTAGGDGVTTTRTDKEGKGWIILAGGELSVTTGSGAGAVRASANSRGGGMRGGRGNMGGWGAAGTTTASDNGVSQKAVKAATDLTVLDGIYTFNCADDGLHGVNVTVNGGGFSIKSGDDGMHADSEMTVNGGVISIAQCYEGLEGTNVTVNGGDISIVASDDGVNASGGKDASGFGGRGGNRFGANGAMLTVSGGYLEVTASGDGLDSNGSLAISGGVVGIWSASSVGEGAIDFNGTSTLSGGTVILAGNNGFMTSGLSGSTFVSVPMNGSGAAGNEITVVTADGTASFTPQGAFSSIAVAGSGIIQGQSLTVSLNERQLFSGTVTADMSTGLSGGFSGGRGGMGRGGRGGMGWNGFGDGNTGDQGVDGVTSPTDSGNTEGPDRGNRRKR